MRLRVVLATVSAALLLVMVGCSGAHSNASSGNRPRLAGFSACPTPTGPAVDGHMPRIQLPCMDGSGRSLTLGRPLGLPTVINLWGSWCPPCGRELPAFVSLQKIAAGKAVVMGVVTEDSADRSVDAAHELGVQFPNLYDRHGELRRRLGISALPATLFVAASGELVKIYVGPVLDEAALREQIGHNLGVRLDRAG